MSLTKKIIAIAMVSIIALSLTACTGGTTGNLPALDAPVESGAEPVVKTMSEADCEDTLEGLCKYLEGNGIITGEQNEMEYEVIGAKAGVKYFFTYNKKNIQVELYEFDPADTANEHVNSVKENGFFQVLDAEVPAVMSESGKYMMIYADNEKDDANVNQKNKAIKTFIEFKAGSAN